MSATARRLAVICLCAALAACNAPRGAGFQSEVLKAARTQADAADAADADAPAGAAVPAEFAVVPVTRATQAQLAGWPAIGPQRHDWIRRQEQPASMIIAPGDVVSVVIWDTEENSLLAGPGQRQADLPEMKVTSSGAIFLPFIGEMRVQGMSPQTARAKIEERYATAIPSAQVQVSVRPGRANTADLVSGVASPGSYPLEDRDVTILSLISLAGGVQPGLENPQVRLFRGSAVYGISLERLFGDPGFDTTLVGGDRVIIESEKRFFLSLGAAGTEAEHIFPRDRVTALEAMSIIGGLSDARANPKGILVLREYPAGALRADGAGPPHRRVIFTLDLTSADGLFSARNFTVMPGDLVYVSESPLTATRTVLGLVGSVFGIANTATNAAN